MVEDLTSQHASRIVAITQDKKTASDQSPDANIARSWERCIDDYGIDPAHPHKTRVLENIHVKEHQERMDRVLEIARIEMSSLYQQISRSGFAILMTDSEGVIINSVSDPTLIRSFLSAGLWMGAVWSEEFEGTNGIGTCILERQPLTVHQDDHFRSCHTNLTCSASPIFDPHGKLLAVLDASSVNSRDSKQGQFHTVALVTMSAKMIENCSFLNQFHNDWVLRFHNRPEFIGMLSEGMLAFNGDGRILAVNQSALNQLNFRTREELIGRPISEVFAARLDTLMERANHQATAIWPVYDCQGHGYSAMLRGPERRPRVESASAGKGVIGPARMPLAMTLDGLQGDDPLMTYNVRCARRVMDKDVSILLAGETGTGKEAIARAIHNASNRADKPFIAVNCASIPESLIESELFGYKHGAFTGARREGMRGKILQSGGGTLFLDEIGDMPPQLQTRLLRVLEDKQVMPLGGETPISVELHVISATHRNLQELVSQGDFREDLYYRLNGLTLTLPALRERADRATLIRCVLAAESENENIHFDEETFAALSAYPWPGNIRQLRNVLRTAVALCEGGVIQLQDLPPEIAQVSAKTLAQRVTTPKAEAGGALACAEREALLQELENQRWNISGTAQRLGISRNTIYRKMKKHGITPPTLAES